MDKEFFGYFAAILTTVAFLPQLINTYMEKVEGFGGIENVHFTSFLIE